IAGQLVRDPGQDPGNVQRIALVGRLASGTEREWRGENDCDSEGETKGKEGLSHDRSSEVRTEAQMPLQNEPRLARRVLEVLLQNVGHAAGELLGVADVQELVRSVRVALGPQDSGDHELRFRKLLAQHA